jgi:hypothetical protein
MLTASNTVVVNVNVVNPEIIIQTDTLDGISFYAAGHFTQAGSQTVTLRVQAPDNAAESPVYAQAMVVPVHFRYLSTIPEHLLSCDSGRRNLCIGTVSGVIQRHPLNTPNTLTLVYGDIRSATISRRPLMALFLCYR